MSTKDIFLGGKDGRCVGLITLQPSYANCLEILGASVSWSPEGLSRPVMGELYKYQKSMISREQLNIKKKYYNRDVINNYGVNIVKIINSNLLLPSQIVGFYFVLFGVGGSYISYYLTYTFAGTNVYDVIIPCCPFHCVVCCS